MEPLTRPQQSKFTWAPCVHVSSFPQVQDIPVLSGSPSLSLFESETEGDPLYSTSVKQVLNANKKETNLTGFTLDEQVDHLFTFYTPIRLKEVKDFLEENEFLIPLLFATYLNIEKHFSCSQVTLDVETDYEYPDWQNLAVHVIPSVSLAEAWQQLKQFDGQWWVRMPKQALPKLYVNLEFE